jgi:hypothetical protein
MLEVDKEPKLIAEGPCGPRMLRLHEKRWNGGKILDLRLWYWHDRAGEYRPARQGIQLSAEGWRGVIREIQAACEQD